MNLFSIIISIIICGYLIIQSISDIKTKKVRVLYNDLMLWFITCHYLGECIMENTFPTYSIIFIIFLIILASIFHIFGSGDAKAFIIILISTRYWQINILHPNILIFAYFIIITNAICLIYHFIKRKITKTKEKRIAYFPFMTIGYILLFIFNFLK